MNNTLEEAIAAIGSGDKDNGRRLLVKVLKEEPRNEKAWLLMADVINDPAKKRQSLQTVLDINPNNREARERLESLNNDKGLEDVYSEQASSLIQRITSLPSFSVAVLSGVLLSCILLSIVGAVVLVLRSSEAGGAAATEENGGVGMSDGSLADEQSCLAESADYIANVDDLLQRWDDANAIANNTARIALSQPVSELQALRREAATFTPPTCAKQVHEQLLTYMNLTIDTYLDFMAESGDVVVERGFNRAGNALDRFIGMYVALQEDRLHSYEPPIPPTRTRWTATPTPEPRQITYEIESDAAALIIEYTTRPGRTEGGRYEPPWPEPVVPLGVGKSAHLSLSGLGSGDHYVVCRIKMGDEVLDENRGDMSKKVICNARIPEN